MHRLTHLVAGKPCLPDAKRPIVMSQADSRKFHRNRKANQKKGTGEHVK